VPTDATPPETTRLALVGAASLLGQEIKSQLAASGLPGDAVALFDLDELAGVLTDYGNEARVFAEAVAERVLNHELVCFCGDQGTATAYLDALLEGGGLSLDCTGAWLEDDRVSLWAPGVNPPPHFAEHRATTMPPATTLMLARTMAALGDLGSGASANIFLPSSERGDGGLHEMSQQATAVLNLLDVEDAVFGRQQAFDLWMPPADDPMGAASLGANMARLDVPVPAINVLSASVFHGMALSVFIPGAESSAVGAALQDAGIEGVRQEGGEDAIDSPVQVVGHSGIHGVEVRADADGVWIWLVADNLRTRAAAAVAAVHTLLGQPLTDAPQ